MQTFSSAAGSLERSCGQLQAKSSWAALRTRTQQRRPHRQPGRKTRGGAASGFDRQWRQPRRGRWSGQGPACPFRKELAPLSGTMERSEPELAIETGFRPAADRAYLRRPGPGRRCGRRQAVVQAVRRIPPKERDPLFSPEAEVVSPALAIDQSCRSSNLRSPALPSNWTQGAEEIRPLVAVAFEL